jgi:lipopolysaccharide export system protein LptA
MRRSPALAAWFALALAPALLWAAPAAAQDFSTLAAKGEGPLEVFAEDGIEWRRDEQLYIARGNAVAKRAELSLKADTLIAHYHESEKGGTEIDKVEAVGNVIIQSPKEKIVGDRAVFLIDQGLMQVTGKKLRLTTASEEVSARDSLEYWQDYQGAPVAVARGEAVVNRPAAKQRIRGDVITATFARDAKDKQEISQVDAFGDVRIATEHEFARGDRAVYYVKEDQALLEGNVKITRGDNQLNGQRAELNLKTGVSRLLAGGQTQVRGLLSPDGLKTPEAR